MPVIVDFSSLSEPSYLSRPYKDIPASIGEKGEGRREGGREGGRKGGKERGSRTCKEKHAIMVLPVT